MKEIGPYLETVDEMRKIIEVSIFQRSIRNVLYPHEFMMLCCNTVSEVFIVYSLAK